MSKITHLFFDNDGILVDTEMKFIEANMMVYPRYIGRPYTLEDFQHYSSLTNKGSKQFFVDMNVPEKYWKEMKEKRDAIWLEKINSEDIYIPGVKEAIPELSKKYKLCIVTSNQRQFFNKSHKDKEFLNYFDKIFTAEDCKVIKPDPEAYLNAFEYYGIKPENAVIIEDAPRGVVAGKASGAKTIALRNQVNEKLNLSAADEIIESFEELRRLL